MLPIITIFTAGILTFFTPCVLPIVPIYLAAITGGDMASLTKSPRRKVFLRALSFSAGFILVFAMLGAAASGIGSALKVYQQFIMLFGGVVILLFGLKFIGFIQIPLFDRILRLDDSRLGSKTDTAIAFIMGVVFGAGWSPCIGPVLGSVLTYTAASAKNIPEGTAYLTIYGIGFALPFIAVSLFAGQGIAAIRKMGRFLPVLEKITGIILITASFYMFGQAVEPPAQSNEAVKTETSKPEPQPTKLVSKHQMPMLIEFYSHNCEVCRSMEPTVNAIFSRCQGNKVEFDKIDISLPENRHYISEYRIIGVPTFILTDTKGNEAARLVGYQTEQSLYQAIATLRGEACEGVDKIDGSWSINAVNQECLGGKTCN